MTTMNRNQLLKKIAHLGYKADYAALLNYFTFKCIVQIPRAIALISFTIGLFGFGYASSNPALFRSFSCAVLLLSFTSLMISKSDYNAYKVTADNNIQQRNNLEQLYYQVFNLLENDSKLNDIESKVIEIEKDFNQHAQSQQFILAHWYAHYKFFTSNGHSWIDDNMNFKFWKNMVPPSIKFLLVLLLLGVILCTMILIYTRYL